MTRELLTGNAAAAWGARTVVLFGPTDPAVWAPDAARGRTVRARTGEIADVSVDEVAAAVAAL